MDFLLYGSYGYTGQLIVERALQLGLRPLLSGRSADKLEQQATQTGLPYQVLDLQDTATLEETLQGVPLVLHCAGPFAHTYRAMAAACLKTSTHYLDITGEIEVFEGLAGMDQAAKQAGIMLLPGAGFDVVPTDCMAAFLSQQLSEASHLELAFQALAGLSHGTAKTAIENLGAGGMVRKGGTIVSVPSAHATRMIPYADKPLLSVAIPWGDVSTAWYTTGIPNITTYTVQPPQMIRMMKVSRYLGWLLNRKFVQNYLKRQVEKRPAGPSAEKRARSYSMVWGEVRNPEGKIVQARYQTPEGYSLTAQTSLALVQKVLAGDAPLGFQTPAGAYGYEWFVEMPDVSELELLSPKG